MYHRFYMKARSLLSSASGYLRCAAGRPWWWSPRALPYRP